MLYTTSGETCPIIAWRRRVKQKPEEPGGMYADPKTRVVKLFFYVEGEGNTFMADAIPHD